MNELSPLAIVGLFAAIAKALTEHAYKPIRSVVQEVKPDSAAAVIADKLTPYIAWVISALLVWFSQVNLFEGIMPTVPGIIFTAIASGLGANLLADTFDWPKTLARELTMYNVAAQEVLEAEKLEFAVCAGDIEAEKACCAKE